MPPRAGRRQPWACRRTSASSPPARPSRTTLGELWTLFRFLNPGLLSTKQEFERRFATPIERGDSSARAGLKRLLAPFILRRTKTQVLNELPTRTDITLHVDLTPEERALYESLRRQAIETISKQKGQQARMQVLAELMRLRRACCHPRLVRETGASTTASSAKLEAFGELLEELLENRHKALVFSQFVDHLEVVRKYLDDQGVAYQYLDGSTPMAERQQRVAAFQAGQGDVFLISLRAGGSGLNLTAADYVIHLDPWWNPAVEDQASDRAHRIGQQRPVTVYRIVARDTVEDRIVDLHRRKRDLAESMLEGTEAATRVTAADLLRLLESMRKSAPTTGRLRMAVMAFLLLLCVPGVGGARPTSQPPSPSAVASPAPPASRQPGEGIHRLLEGSKARQPRGTTAAVRGPGGNALTRTSTTPWRGTARTRPSGGEKRRAWLTQAFKRFEVLEGRIARVLSHLQTRSWPSR